MAQQMSQASSHGLRKGTLRLCGLNDAGDLHVQDGKRPCATNSQLTKDVATHGSDARTSHTAAMTTRSELWLPTLLSVIAGMVDVIGFLSLGIFTAHVTGNIVVIGALMVRHNPVNPAQILAVPVFILAVAATWLIAKASRRRGSRLMQPLLLIQFLLITFLLVFSIITKPSTDPHGVMATIAAMIAVTAMGCQFALLRLTLPVAPSTAVMTGNLTNAVLALVDLSSRKQPLVESSRRRLTGALQLLIGFFVGCVVATA